MGLRGPHANRLTWLYPVTPTQPAPKPKRLHRFLCCECRKPFRAVRDDARFCGDRCRQRNCRRRGEMSAESRKNCWINGLSMNLLIASEVIASDSGAAKSLCPLKLTMWRFVRR